MKYILSKTTLYGGEVYRTRTGKWVSYYHDAHRFGTLVLAQRAQKRLKESHGIEARILGVKWEKNLLKIHFIEGVTR